MCRNKGNRLFCMRVRWIGFCREATHTWAWRINAGHTLNARCGCVRSDAYTFSELFLFLRGIFQSNNVPGDGRTEKTRQQKTTPVATVTMLRFISSIDVKFPI